VEKLDGKVKGCTCANGNTQRGYINKEDAASPAVATKSISITATINAKQGWDVMTIDVPNSFFQTDMEKIDRNRVIMKICGPLETSFIPGAIESSIRYPTGRIITLQEIKERFRRHWIKNQPL
jgi:hypothetical protein